MTEQRKLETADEAFNDSMLLSDFIAMLTALADGLPSDTRITIRESDYLTRTVEGLFIATWGTGDGMAEDFSDAYGDAQAEETKDSKYPWERLSTTLVVIDAYGDTSHERT